MDTTIKRCCLIDTDECEVLDDMYLCDKHRISLHVPYGHVFREFEYTEEYVCQECRNLSCYQCAVPIEEDEQWISILIEPEDPRKPRAGDENPYVICGFSCLAEWVSFRNLKEGDMGNG